ncbi:hypothetical protein CW745_12595 [Psychromonas sp. psych-6C06]|uniref:hypothetical protein n=1 Tax=Psychromonas sp. psych-6C06 TaxID=2058089 RepID=UPI000C32FA36|nr:hypothetical protein [Psychromonas sp. psych-6C06]PKF61135.1 hypothetical protein CW745_12595 [Psychromonas sp. psych-6C06]
MSNKQWRYRKTRYIGALVAIGTLYIAFSGPADKTNNNNSTIDNTAQFLPSVGCKDSEMCDNSSTQSTLPVETSITALPAPPPAIKTTESDFIPTDTTISPVDLYEAPPPVIIQLQGKALFKEVDFANQDIHQCTIEFDRQSVVKINQIIEQMSYNITLKKSSYKIQSGLTLNIISGALTESFNEILVHKIQTLLQIYRQSFALNLNKQSEINLVILPSQESYQEFISQLSLDATNTQGLFWARSNYAFVAFRDTEQAAVTAFHEAVHAINFSLVGLQSRWSNEGLAELFENMRVAQVNGSYTVSLKLPYLQYNQTTPMDFQNLVYAENQWGDINQMNHLYSSAFSFVSYLFSDKKGMSLVSDLLQEESLNPCLPLSMDQYFQMIDEQVYYLPSSFDEWIIKMTNNLNY